MGISNSLIDTHLLIRRLIKIRPGLKKEPHHVQRGIAEILLQSHQKHRQHKDEEGHIVIFHQEIYDKIAKGAEGFEILTTRHNLFTSPGNFSVKQGAARAFRVVDDVESELVSFFAGWTYRQHRRKNLESKKGKPFKLNAAIASKDSRGIDAKAQGKNVVANYVEIDVDRVKDYQRQLKQTQKNAEEHGQIDMFAGDDMNEVNALIGLIGRMMESTVILDGKTVLLHTYIESEMGRLYAQGINLQNIKKDIRNLVLQGYWDYDIESCHHSILYQLASHYGLNLPALGDYIARKQAIRQQIADEVGITLDQAKTCLTMLIYGAYQSTRDPDALGWDGKKHKDAIPGEIGLERALVLYAHPVWKALSRDITQGRNKVISTWPDRGRKNNKVVLVNALGKHIAPDADQKVILAHLLQGIEAKMLEAVRLLYPNTLTLMMHDGFVSRVPLDVERMEEAIAEATGFIVNIDDKGTIQPSEHLGLKR